MQLNSKLYTYIRSVFFFSLFLQKSQAYDFNFVNVA